MERFLTLCNICEDEQHRVCAKLHHYIKIEHQFIT
jgi:hypothetical protein